MELFEIVELALDEAIAMDGDENSVRASGWLQEHDDRYHGGHYEDGQRCKLREKLTSRDNADRLGGESQALQQLQNAPSKDHFQELMIRLHSDGQLDDEDFDDISRMARSAYSALAEADEENFERHDELRDNLLALNELYQALNQAYPDNVEAPAAATAPAAAPQNAAPNAGNNNNPNDQRVPAIRRLVGNYRERLSTVGHGQFPEAHNWNRDIQRVVGNNDTSACIRELLDHPENPAYRQLLDNYTAIGVAHPSSWAARFMGTIERLHPNWRAAVDAQRIQDQMLDQRSISGSSFTVSLSNEEERALSRCRSDRERAEVARRSYERRRALGQTSHVEDVFHESGVHCLGPGRIWPKGNNRDGCCCFACHAVTAMRALYGAVCDPNANWPGAQIEGAVWFEARAKAFFGAKVLKSPDQASPIIRDAPIGSVIMTTSGGHCYNLYKTIAGWLYVDTYSHDPQETDVLSVEQVMSHCNLSNSEADFNRGANSRVVSACREGGVPSNIPNDLVAVAGKGAFLITPDQASNVNPEYLVGAVTGRPHDPGAITPRIWRIMQMMKGRQQVNLARDNPD